MKTLIKRKAYVSILMTFLFLVSCGQSNTTSNTNPFSNTGFGGMGGINGGISNFGGGTTGSPTLDGIIQQTSCQGSQGPNAYSLLAVSNQGGVTTVINPNMIDIANVYVGRNTYGDVVILKSMGSYAEMIIKVCARSFLYGAQMSLSSATNFVVNVSRYCSVNEITSGQAVVRFTSQMSGNYDLPILPSALHLHQPLVQACSGI